jgi:hypothetical protein
VRQDDLRAAGRAARSGSRRTSALVAAAMKARAVALRFLPRRRRPSLRRAMTHPTYPKVYEIEMLAQPSETTR